MYLRMYLVEKYQNTPMCTCIHHIVSRATPTTYREGLASCLYLSHSGGIHLIIMNIINYFIKFARTIIILLESISIDIKLQHAKFMILPTFIIKPHTFHKQYTESMFLTHHKERDEIGIGRMTDPPGTWWVQLARPYIMYVFGREILIYPR